MLDVTYDADTSLLHSLLAAAYQRMPPFQRFALVYQEICTGPRQQRMTYITGMKFDAFVYFLLSIVII
jgi:hypothetical protein